MTCRAYQRGLLSAEAYRASLADIGPTALRSAVVRAHDELKLPQTLGPDWIGQSAHLQAACLGLGIEPGVATDAEDFCEMHFPVQAPKSDPLPASRE